MSKISELSDGGVIQGGDTLIAVRSGGNVKVTYGGTTTANIDGGTIDGTTIGGTTPAAGSFTTGSFTGNVTFGDNDKAIFGAGSDLQIYHSGTNSFIQEQGTGDLYITTNGSKIDMMTNGLSEYGVRIFQDGEVSLYHNGLAKLATTSTGIDVTGSVTADALTVGGTLGNFDISTGGNQATFDYNGFNYINFSGSGAVLAVRRTGSLTTTSWSSNGDINLGYEDTGTTAKLVWKSSAESLGIGTSSPSTLLELAASNNGSENNTLRITDSDTFVSAGDTLGKLEFYATDGAAVKSFVKAEYLNAQGDAELAIGTSSGASAATEKVRISGAGNVGIGTDSPAYSLTVGDGTDASEYLQLKTTNTGTGGILFGDSDANFPAYLWYNHSGNRMEFGVNGDERMRIDSSGNLLVGKSDTNTGVAGAELRANGFNAFCRDGGEVMNINRLTSDGTIIDFRKDSSTVGSIGVDNSDNLYITGNSSHAGLMCGSTEILPYKGTTLNDGANDLGASSFRWKDLYLSGGVVFGTTGGNVTGATLDDYEEGTFTPTLSTGVTSPTYTNQNGSYTKIGNLVYFQIRLKLASGTANNNQFVIGGLPFNSASASDYGGAFISYSSGFLDSLGAYTIHVGPNANALYFYEPNGSSKTGNEIEAAGSVLGLVYINGFYRV